MLDPNPGFQMNDQQCACYINNFFSNLTKNYPKVNEDWLEQASSAGISPEESGGGKKFGEMPAINRHKNLHCANRLAHANFDKLKLRGSRKGLLQGVKKFLFSTRWLTRRVKL